MAATEFSTNRFFQNWQDFHNHQEMEKRLHKGYEKWKPAFPTDLPSAADLDRMKKWAEELRKKGTDVLIVMGMGGSSLGAKAIRDVVDPWSEKVIFWEGPHPAMLQKIRLIAEDNELAVLWVSKSGTTIETRTALVLFREFFPGVPEYFITSQPAKISDLRATEANTFLIPENLGGRYSVISPVGLMPALFMEADVDMLLKSFREGLAAWDISIPLDNNAAKDIAVQYYHLFQSCYSSVVFWVYTHEYMGLGRWLIQLWGESVGKNAGVSALPYLAQGPEDQHSMLQFFQDGPNTFVHSFFHVKSYGANDTVVPADLPGEFADHTLWEILHAQMKGIEAGLSEAHRPVTEYIIPEVSLSEIGRMFSFWMYVVSYLGYLYEVNPFDQPGVEKGKIYAKKILLNEGHEPVVSEVREI